MSAEFDRGPPGNFDSRTLNRETLNREMGRTALAVCNGNHSFNSMSDRFVGYQQHKCTILMHTTSSPEYKLFLQFGVVASFPFCRNPVVTNHDLI